MVKKKSVSEEPPRFRGINYNTMKNSFVWKQTCFGCKDTI